ncbi:MAG: carbamoyltransferase HypF [Hyphomicrobiaceae bacterium]
MNQRRAATTRHDGTGIAGVPHAVRPAARSAVDIVVEGRVQGVGFRPFVHALAKKHDISGSVRNLSGRVLVHAEGEAASLAAFERDLVAAAPPLARPSVARVSEARLSGIAGFSILASAATEDADVHLPPDLHVCVDCLAELRDPRDRRYGYPFINCTQCGPRYTIVARLPYDRAQTSMAAFDLCSACRAEYENPASRRFHAEPVACEQCGPTLTFLSGRRLVAGNNAAIAAACALIAGGGIVAVKGVGGYHLVCDATNDAAIETLRQKKHRPSKPLAVLFPEQGEDGLDAVRRAVTLDDVTAAMLRDARRPIVLVPRRDDGPLSDLIAPGLAEVGVFLPYSPLHALLLDACNGPLVATSGNISGEPVITTNDDADRRLAPVADGVLHHDRAILRPADDSVYRVVAGMPRAIRLGRGAAPLEIALPQALAAPLLALGGEMKAAIALGVAGRAIIAPHIGEMTSPRAIEVLSRQIVDLPRLHGVEVSRIVVDAHSGFASARLARAQSVPVIAVQHHVAHASALAGEHRDVARWLVFAWDGVGLGDDRTLWGGEALLGAPGAWRRVASFRPFHLLGGDEAARQPWRSAAALCWEAQHDYAPPLPPRDVALARGAWSRRLNAPATSAVGRLFDAAAALILQLTHVSFEGEGPMRLEALASRCNDADAGPSDRRALPLGVDAAGILRADWSAMLDMLGDASLEPRVRALRFHRIMAATLVAQVERVLADHSGDHVHAPSFAIGLTGGVFQNQMLAEMVVRALGARGFDVRLPVLVPCNDGGLAFGQLVEAAARLALVPSSTSDTQER